MFFYNHLCSHCSICRDTRYYDIDEIANKMMELSIECNEKQIRLDYVNIEIQKLLNKMLKLSNSNMSLQMADFMSDRLIHLNFQKQATQEALSNSKNNYQKIKNEFELSKLMIFSSRKRLQSFTVGQQYDLKVVEVEPKGMKVEYNNEPLFIPKAWLRTTAFSRVEIGNVLSFIYHGYDSILDSPKFSER